MARTLYFTDGTCEVLLCDPDDTEGNIAALERILRERLGNDAADLLDSIVTNIEQSQIEKCENCKED